MIRNTDRYSIELFEQWAEEAWQDLPFEFKNHVANLAIFVHDDPDPALLRSMNLSRRSTLLGVYQGVPLSHRGSYYMNVLPDSIILFRNSILRICRTEEDIKQQIRMTLIHEIGHHFGLSESEIRDAMED
jgi:predicted Zn-dependent protease with MMP-like domain